MILYSSDATPESWLTYLRTGMHVIAATFLLPVGVALYTFVGGIKATYFP